MMAEPNPLVRRYGTAAIAEAAMAIRAGRLVAIPTETVYGLAADAGDSAAVARIYAAKGRPSFNPLIVHVRDRAEAERLAVFDATAAALADAFWPGPLTLVLPLRKGAPIAALVTAGLETVAIRVPAHRAMLALLVAADRPLAAPSANRSNGISPTRAAHVVASLGAAAELVIDDGPCAAGLESTIVAGATLLRPGPVTAEAIGRVLGRLVSGGEKPAGDTITAPGQLATHYAPAKPLRLDARWAEADEWLIGFDGVEGDDTLSASGDLTEAAARLFDALHRADASDRARIAVAPLPATGIGEAIHDRLRRAATR
ncbi:L-threonylcarbamoyladenylate synthase [Sphingomonas sp. SORGH_AS802]|uniref:L-threonylcarbamoyladenylate synthase n=1 Tax=unclassified Sphingomonas TaxID=196159 RepID=UPI0028628940|nr:MULTISPECIES: L-threonylcarbamoyladenylate synthase [unclassified Sphingomonas]MDR6128943.1 L-threonylcarbamoyladenylate synthase [Sphingomonas sp. SORGH_AS_0438]MDR6136047.1 L-threonylcarbamoyladenylate synthase [Sphingomonas sp. SORGH_AS_0802]